MSVTNTQEASGSQSNGVILDLNAPVSKSIGKAALEEAKKVEEAKRKPHNAAFRGWKEVGGWEKEDELTPEDEIMDLLSRSTLLEQYLPEKFYGDWYHSVAIIILGGFLSWLFGKFKFSLGPVFIVSLALAMVYRVSIRKYRHNLRLEALREFSVAHIEDDFESMDWLNVFLEKYWPYLEPSIAQQVCDIANPIIASQPAIPAFIKEIWIESFTLGGKPPRIDRVRTLERTSDDITVMDWCVSFTPSTKEDATVKQVKNRVSAFFNVKAKVGPFTFPVIVSDIAFNATFRVRIRMMSKFPHIQTVNVSLMEAPHFDFVAKPIGGNNIFSWEVLNLPGLFMFINEMVKKFVGPIVFSPLSFQLNLEQLLAGNGNGALGILEIKVKNAKDLKGADRYENTIDPYLTFGFGTTVLTRTKSQPDTNDPVWNEKVNVILKSSSEPLQIMVFDDNENDGKKDKFMGAVLYDLEELMSKNVLKDVSLPLLRNNKPIGNVNVDLKFMKSLQGSTLPDGSYSPPPDLNTGVAKIEILGAKNYSQDTDAPASIFAELYFEGNLIFTSGVTKKSNEASFSYIHEQIVTDRSKSKVRVVLRDATSKSKKKKIIGSRTLDLSELIDYSYANNLWLPLSKGLGEVKMSCNWNSVRMSGVKGSMGYRAPIGVVRLFIASATDLVNLEKIGVIDPYVRVMVNGIQRGRTLAVESTTDPVYNEVLFIPVSSPNQIIDIEAMDVQRSTQDRTLGSLSVRLNEIIDYDEAGNFIETVGEDKEGVLYNKKRGAKGSIKYNLSFFPTLPVKSADDLKEEEAQKEAKLKSQIERRESVKSQENKDAKAKEEEEEEEEDDEESDVKEKLELPLEKIKEYPQGDLVFTVLEGNFPSAGHVQVFFDKAGYPAFASDKVQAGKNVSVGLTGDNLIKELDYSNATIKFSSDPKNDFLKQSIAEVSITTLELLNYSYDKPSWMKLSNNCSILVQCRWIPVLMKELSPMDSIGNSGVLSLKIVSADGLPAGDSNGKSDPFVKAYIDGKEQYKTKTIKKTLSPTWNEQTEINVYSRCASILRLKVNDWDFGIEQDDTLCDVHFRLENINPFSDSYEEFTLDLTDDDDKPAGTITIACKFAPRYFTRLNAEKKLPNFADNAITDGAKGVIGIGGKTLGTGVDGVKGVVGVGGKVLTGATGLFSKKKK